MHGNQKPLTSVYISDDMHITVVFFLTWILSHYGLRIEQHLKSFSDFEHIIPYIQTAYIKNDSFYSFFHFSSITSNHFQFISP